MTIVDLPSSIRSSVKGSQPREADPLLRGASSSSLEDWLREPLLNSPSVAPLSLKVCLQDLFSSGWSPEPRACGMYRLEEEAVRWLKSVDKVTLTDEIPVVLQNLLSDFRALSSSTRKLDDTAKEHAQVLAAARATVDQQLL